MKDKLIKKIFKLIKEDPDNWIFREGEYIYAYYNFINEYKITVACIDNPNIMRVSVYEMDIGIIYEIDMQTGISAMPFGWRRRMCWRLMKIFYQRKSIPNKKTSKFEEKYLSDV